MVDQPAAKRARTRPETTAPRPHVARELVRTVAACRVAVIEASRFTSSLSVHEAVDRVATALHSRPAGTHEDAVCETLLELVRGQVEEAVSVAEASFADAAGLGPTHRGGDLLTAARQRGALAHAGIHVGSVSAAALAPHRRRLVVRALDRLIRLQEDLRACGGDLLTRLVAAYRSVDSSLPVADAIAELVAHGVDGERLAAEVIRFETLKHFGLIWLECNRQAKRLPDRTPASLFSWGWDGLRLALRNYDPERNAFSTYACLRIRGAIRDGVRSERPIPKRLTTLEHKAARVEEELTQMLGRAPRLAEVRAHMAEHLEQVDLLPRLQPAASLEELSNPYAERSTEPACLVDPIDPADVAIESVRRQAINDALCELPDDMATAVRLLVLEERSTVEAATITGVSPRQLRTRLRNGLTRLGPVLADWVEELG